MSVFAAHLGSSETMANLRICIHDFDRDRTRGLCPQCRSAGVFRDTNIATVALNMYAGMIMYGIRLVERSSFPALLAWHDLGSLGLSVRARP